MLATDVPEDVCNNFERGRKLHLHGVLEYEFFTAAGDYALLVLEGALRTRFLAFYPDGIPLRRKRRLAGTSVCRSSVAVSPAKGGSQRVGAINLEREWDAVILVLLDEEFNATEIYEASRDALTEALQRPGSRAPNERGQLSVSQLDPVAGDLEGTTW